MVPEGVLCIDVDDLTTSVTIISRQLRLHKKHNSMTLRLNGRFFVRQKIAGTGSTVADFRKVCSDHLVAASC
jgi:uncharacterized protein YmfQ (DUF2313 family)